MPPLALEVIDVFGPELIFTEICLPDKNALEFIRHIKRYHPDVSVIVLASYDYPEYRQAALTSGADHFIAAETTGLKEMIAIVESVVSPSNSINI